MSENVDDSEVCVETTILVDLAQEGGDSPGYTLFRYRDAATVTTPHVRVEFDRKKENREYIVEEFQRQIGSGDPDFEELSIPTDEHLSPQDLDYARELLAELARSEDARQANLELARRRSRFRKVHGILFGEDGVVEVYPADIDPHLRGNLRGPIDNRDDAVIIAEAADWANTRNTETVLSMDRKDIISNADAINDAISRTPGFDCMLSIYHLRDFLKATERMS